MTMVAARVILSACVAMAVAGCGQRGALYMPDKNASVVTRAGASAPSAAPSSAPAAAPAAEPR
jgi:predicted small lipoprotein YifL